MSSRRDVPIRDCATVLPFPGACSSIISFIYFIFIVDIYEILDNNFGIEKIAYHHSTFNSIIFLGSLIKKNQLSVRDLFFPIRNR